jgi:hypothetical protein
LYGSLLVERPLEVSVIVDEHLPEILEQLP